MHPTKKAAHERAADENILQDHNTMPAQVVQAVDSFKAGIMALRQIVNVVGIQCYLGGEVEVQVDSAQDLEHLPGELVVTKMSYGGKYPYRLRKTVAGIDFIALAEDDPTLAGRENSCG